MESRSIISTAHIRTSSLTNLYPAPRIAGPAVSAAETPP